jgi:hypothetical protein
MSAFSSCVGLALASVITAAAFAQQAVRPDGYGGWVVNNQPNLSGNRGGPCDFGPFASTITASCMSQQHQMQRERMKQLQLEQQQQQLQLENQRLQNELLRRQLAREPG